VSTPALNARDLVVARTAELTRNATTKAGR
jgi:hypothetical protein